MCAVRYFENTGQALFSVERHGDATIVYDCGGENRDLVRHAIPHVLSEGEKIDALFISHYDRDHINGVQDLLLYCNVQHIILPMIEDFVKLAALQKVPSNSFVYQFVLTPQQAIRALYNDYRAEGLAERSEPSIHYVGFAGEEINYNERPNEDYIDEDGGVLLNGIGVYISSGTRIKTHRGDDWVYIPFNRRTMSTINIQLFKAGLGIPQNATSEDIIKAWKERRGKKKISKDIKEIWSNITMIAESEINNYSMTLYSGPLKHHWHEGCLYTGDYNAKDNMAELRNAYDIVWENIRIVQIPHHGSYHNFHDDLINILGIHVIPNKKHKVKESDVDATLTISNIKKHGGYVVATWQRDIYIPIDFPWTSESL